VPEAEQSGLKTSNIFGSNFTQARKIIRSYDIEKIRQQRVLESFRIGRQIKVKENTDRRINSEIESTVLGLCKRKPALRKGSIFEGIHHVHDMCRTKDCQP